MFFVFTTLAFLVRIEGFLLFIVYVIREIEFKKLIFFCNRHRFNLKLLLKKNLPALLFFIFSISLTIFETIHNKNFDQTPYGNQYLYEMSSMTLRTENFVYIFGLIGAFFFPQTFVWWGMDLLNPGFLNGIIIFTSVLTLSLGLAFKKTRTYGFYILFLALIHSFFPALETRYFYLFLNLFIINVAIIIQSFYLQTKLQLLKFLIGSIIILSSLLWMNLSVKQAERSFPNFREIGLDLYHNVSDWMFNHMGNGNYYIFAEKEYLYSNIYLNSKAYLNQSETGVTINKIETNEVLKISIGKKSLNFVRLSGTREKCQNFDCLLKLVNPEEDAKFIFIAHQWSNFPEKDFWWHYNGLEIIEELLEKPSCLIETMSFDFKNTGAYRKLYYFDKNCYMNNNK
jgi:hypothetical protein